jgi:hypothetical protein
LLNPPAWSKKFTISMYSWWKKTACCMPGTKKISVDGNSSVWNKWQSSNKLVYQRWSKSCARGLMGSDFSGARQCDFTVVSNVWVQMQDRWPSDAPRFRQHNAPKQKYILQNHVILKIMLYYFIHFYTILVGFHFSNTFLSFGLPFLHKNNVPQMSRAGLPETFCLVVEPTPLKNMRYY